MPSYSIPSDNGKYDFLITITLAGSRVTMQENEGRDGGGATIWQETHEFGSEAEAEAFYQAEIHRRDPDYAVVIAETTPTPENGEVIYLTFSDDRSHKFYEVTVAGVTVTVRYGRVGSAGQTSNSSYATPEKARAAAEKKINEKLKKGYVRSHPSEFALTAYPVETPSQPALLPYWLPEDFRVYTNDRGIVAVYADGVPGFEARLLPTVNQYAGEDGGYVAFYSRDPAKAVYSIGGGIYVIGQIRLQGRYIGRIFHPAGYENQDISAAPEFKDLCRHTFGVEGWAGGDTGGWFGKDEQASREDSVAAYFPEATSAPLGEISGSTTPVLAATLQTGEEVWWRTGQLRSPCIVEMVIISQSHSLSFNLMAGEHFAYHFNPRPHEGQIVQNTHVEHWGPEERIPLPEEMAFGREFRLTIALKATELMVDLNGRFLCRYRHRIHPTQIDGLRLVCAQGNLQILSVKLVPL